MYRFFSKKVQDRIQSLTQGSGVGIRELWWLDQLWTDAETILLNPPTNVLYTEQALWFASNMSWSENIFKSICNKFNIKPNYLLFKRCEKYAAKLDFNAHNEFLDTYSIDENKFYHKYLYARAKRETQVFGSFPLYRWFLYFCSIAGQHYVELAYISGLVHKASPNILFKTSKRDNSGIDHFCLFYNIVNIVECLLNICELRMSLVYSKISIGGELFDLYEILDELAGVIPVSPKVRIKEIRNFLNFAVRHAGAYSTRPSYVHHDGASPISELPSNNLVIRGDDPELLAKFLYIPTTINALEEGRAKLKALKLDKLLRLINKLLICSFLDAGTIRATTPNDFTVCCSFLLNIMRIAGYGRGLKRLAINESKPERDDDYGGIAVTVKDMWMNFHNQALKAGFSPTKNEDFIHRCVGSWKSTSSGMPAMKVDVNVDGIAQTVSVRKKMATGALMGDTLFKREAMDKKLTKEAPGKVGARDVPYKATRIIYPIPMATLHAMIAVSQHLVDYASYSSKAGKRVPYSDIPFTCDHIASGAEETTGVRIVDNIATIIASGSVNSLTLDMDMAGYDACCVYKNFREPMISALKEMDMGQTYGPDQIPWDEMVDYAFGFGHVHDTYWDAGRMPIVFLNDLGMTFLLEMKSLFKLEKFSVSSEMNTDLEKLQGAQLLSEGDYWITKAEIPERYAQYFSVGYTLDGSDLVRLLSEGSGEKTTLCANSIMNLALQQRLFQDMKECKLGRCLRPVINKAIGDDISITMEIIDYSFEAQDVEDFMQLLQNKLSSYGFDISLPKTCFLPRQSEFVQTYAIRGLYIPKDQIMTISSERPRVIDDPLSFVDSFKRLILSRVSRGMNEAAALLHILYHYRVIMSFDLRRKKVSFAGPVPRARLGDMQMFLRAPQFKDHPRVTSFLKVKNKSDVVVFYPSVALAILPRQSGGIGLNARSLCLVHDPSFFLHVMAHAPPLDRTAHMLAYLFFHGLDYPSGFSDSGSVRVDFNTKSLHSLLPMSMLFDDKTVSLVHKMPFSLGRLNAENAPLGLAKRGLQFENFMREVDFKQKEKDYQEYLTKFNNKKLSTKDITMELAPLCFKYGARPITEEHETFIYGLFPTYQIMMRRHGVSLVLSQRKDRRERIRMLIARDPALRSLRSPEDIYSVFRKYGINDESDRSIAVVLLLRMGFREAIASEIVDVYLNFLEFNIEDGLYGALTDDMTSMIDIVSPEAFNRFSFPNHVQGTLRYQVFIFGIQASMYSFVGEIYKQGGNSDTIVPFPEFNEAVQPNSSDSFYSEQLRQFMQLPRMMNILKNFKSRREGIPLLVNLTADLQSASSN